MQSKALFIFVFLLLCVLAKKKRVQQKRLEDYHCPNNTKISIIQSSPEYLPCLGIDKETQKLTVADRSTQEDSGFWCIGYFTNSKKQNFSTIIRPNSKWVELYRNKDNSLELKEWYDGIPEKERFRFTFSEADETTGDFKIASFNETPITYLTKGAVMDPNGEDLWTITAVE